MPKPTKTSWVSPQPGAVSNSVMTQENPCVIVFPRAPRMLVHDCNGQRGRHFTPAGRSSRARGVAAYHTKPDRSRVVQGAQKPSHRIDAHAAAKNLNKLFSRIGPHQRNRWLLLPMLTHFAFLRDGLWSCRYPDGIKGQAFFRRTCVKVCGVFKTVPVDLTSR